MQRNSRENQAFPTESPHPGQYFPLWNDGKAWNTQHSVAAHCVRDMLEGEGVSQLGVGLEDSRGG